MTDVVVVQSKDRTQRTVITWFADAYEAERGNPMAYVGGGCLWVDAEATAEVGKRATNLFRDELLKDPWADLTYLTTHTRDGDGYVHPIKQVTA